MLTDDVYLEYEYFGRKGPFELYGYIDVPKILGIGNSNDKGAWDHGSPLFMEHEPRISIDYLAGRSLAIGPFKEWYVAFDWIYDHGSNTANRANALVATNVLLYSFTHLRFTLVGRYFHNGGNWEDGSELNFGDGNFRARSNGWGYYAGVGYQF